MQLIYSYDSGHSARVSLSDDEQNGLRVRFESRKPNGESDEKPPREIIELKDKVMKTLEQTGFKHSPHYTFLRSAGGFATGFDHSDPVDMENRAKAALENIGFEESRASTVKRGMGTGHQL